MGFSFDDKVDILYDYIVGGVSMNRLMDDYYCNDSREISNVIHHYNFNKKPVPKGKKGEDNGRYSKGSAACRGVNVDWDFIADYVEAYDNGEYWSFEEYLNEFARGYEEEQRRQAQQRQAEAQREAQMRQNAQMEVERKRQEQERQRQLQAQRLAEQKAQAERQGQFNTYINNAQNYFRSGNYDAAVTCLKNAKQIDYTAYVCSFLAESMARSKNASRYANDIIAELNAYKGAGNTLDDWQHIDLAEAYLAVGDKGQACDEFFRAGDMFYERDDFKKADTLYTKARTETGYYSGSTPDAAFRVAYARVQATENRTKETFEFALIWYKKSIENGQQKQVANANAALYARLLGKFAEAENFAHISISYGYINDYSYSNLMLAQMGQKKYLDALSTLKKMDSFGYKYDVWLKGKCIIEAGTGETALAISCFKEYLQRDSFHRESLAYLAEIIKDRNEAYGYAMKYLRCIGKNTVPNEYEHIASIAYKYAKELGDSSKISEALFYNEAEKQRIAEEERLKKEKAKAESVRLMEEGKQFMSEGNYIKAIESFKNAKATGNYEPILCTLLAESMAKSYCVSFYHKDIIAEFEEYKKSGRKLNEAHHILMAESYLALGNKDRACDEWFFAGDIFYDAENYQEADRLYTTAREKTGYYSVNSKNAPFRIAFARGKAMPNATETWNFCIKWYLKAVEKNCSVGVAYSNAAVNAFNLGIYEDFGKIAEAEGYAKKAIENGFKERNTYHTLLKAQMAQEKWAEAFSTIKIMDENSFAYDEWRKGKCIIETNNGDINEAIDCLKSYLKKAPFHKETLLCLAEYSDNTQEQFDYAITLLTNYAQIKDNCGFDYDYIASLALRCAKALADEEKIAEALEFNPEEKKRLEEEKRLKEAEEERLKREAEERRRKEEEERIRVEKKRKDEELLMILF